MLRHWASNCMAGKIMTGKIVIDKITRGKTQTKRRSDGNAALLCAGGKLS